MIGMLKSASIIPHNVVQKSTFLSRSLVCSRNLCSKDETDIKIPQAASLKEESKLEKDGATGKSEPLLQSKETNESKDAAKQKLLSLLSDIKILSNETAKTATSLNLAKAVKRITKKERLENIQKQQKSPEEEINFAVKAVASTFKDDSAKVESELTEKLNLLNASEEISPEIEKRDTLIDAEVSQNLMSSVEEVAETITERPIPARSELTQRLLRLSLDQKDSPEQGKTVKSLIKDMKVESTVSLSLKKSLQAERRPSLKKGLRQKIDLFGSPPLNIFSLDTDIKPDSRNILWGKLQEKELRSMTQFAPANAFEEMIMWTEQGKHWKFPIDNETEMGPEENVGFHEHVFLDHHLKGFPTKGPIRHFMELVVVGLSKNPYITVERKIENIEWFRDYFKEKEELLKECGAM